MDDGYIYKKIPIGDKTRLGKSEQNTANAENTRLCDTLKSRNKSRNAFGTSCKKSEQEGEIWINLKHLWF